MVERTAIIFGKHGIHARPAAAICKVAIKFFDTEIYLIDPEDSEELFDAKSVLSILNLNKNCGEPLIVRTKGPEELNAAEAVVKIIQEFDVPE